MLVPRADYLSGNVRSRLKEARQRADAGVTGLDENIAALEAAKPADAMLSLLGETIRAVAAAMVPLYATLPNEQERPADESLAERLQGMRRRGP